MARRLPCRYATLIEYSKLPGWPKNHSSGKAKYDIEAIRQFINARKSAHNFGGKNGHNGVFNEREQALMERNKIAVQAARFNLEVKMAEYLPRIKVFRDIDTSDAILIRELKKAFENELPPKLEGLKAAQIRQVMVNKFAEVRRMLAGALLRAEGANGS